MRKRTKRRIRLLLILTVVIVLVIICVKKYNVINTDKNKESDIALENEINEVNKQAKKAWSAAYSLGKKEIEEIKEYVEMYLESQNIDVDRYYYTYTPKGVEVNLKHLGLLSQAGYYKTNTNYKDLVKNWQELNNTRGINVVEGRLGLLRKVTDEKVDIVLDKNITEIKEKIIETDLQIGCLVIPKSVTILSNMAFINSTIDEVVLEANIDKLEGHFKDIKTLTKISFTNSIVKITGKTFANTNIEQVNYIGSIEDFLKISHETYFDVPSHKNPCKLYINNDLIDEIVIPEGTEKIKDYALYNYINVQKITMPDSVKNIGTSAFVGTSVKEIIYNGTKEMWEDIEKMEEWYVGEIECIVRCTNGDIEYKKE